LVSRTISPSRSCPSLASSALHGSALATPCTSFSTLIRPRRTRWPYLIAPGSPLWPARPLTRYTFTLPMSLNPSCCCRRTAKPQIVMQIAFALDGKMASRPLNHNPKKKQVPCLSAWDKKLLSRRLDIVVFDDTPPHLPGVGVGGIDDDGLVGTTSFLLAPLLTHRGCELSLYTAFSLFSPASSTRHRGGRTLHSRILAHPHDRMPIPESKQQRQPRTGTSKGVSNGIY
jgi:hypothetical protein